VGRVGAGGTSESLDAYRTASPPAGCGVAVAGPVCRPAPRRLCRRASASTTICSGTATLASTFQPHPDGARAGPMCTLGCRLGTARAGRRRVFTRFRGPTRRHRQRGECAWHQIAVDGQRNPVLGVEHPFKVLGSCLTSPAEASGVSTHQPPDIWRFHFLAHGPLRLEALGHRGLTRAECAGLGEPDQRQRGVRLFEAGRAAMRDAPRAVPIVAGRRQSAMAKTWD